MTTEAYSLEDDYVVINVSSMDFHNNNNNI